MRCPARFRAAVALAAGSLVRMPGASSAGGAQLAYREFFPPLAESERRDVRQADASEARALISSPRRRRHGGEHRASL